MSGCRGLCYINVHCYVHGAGMLSIMLMHLTGLLIRLVRVGFNLGCFWSASWLGVAFEDKFLAKV